MVFSDKGDTMWLIPHWTFIRNIRESGPCSLKGCKDPCTLCVFWVRGCKGSWFNIQVQVIYQIYYIKQDKHGVLFQHRRWDPGSPSVLLQESWRFGLQGGQSLDSLMVSSPNPVCDANSEETNCLLQKIVCSSGKQRKQCLCMQVFYFN